MHNFFFDDDHWTVRYLVAEAGGWLHSRKVLLSPACLGHPDWEKRVFPVTLTRDQVCSQPDIDVHQPVSRQQEIEMSSYYGWPVYWSIEPMVAVPVAVPATREEARHGDPHLRSAREVVTYRVRGKDGPVGHMADLIVHEESWRIQELVVDMGSWRTGHRVLMPPEKIAEISWAHRELVTTLRHDEAAALPEFDPAKPVNRWVEEHTYDYYGRPAGPK
ncbi:MAG: hypothetical protein R2729_26670 [Bryobacteraceae bacterium]